MAFVLRYDTAPQPIGVGFFNVENALNRLREPKCSEKPAVPEPLRTSVAVLVEYVQRQPWAVMQAASATLIDVPLTFKLALVASLPTEQLRTAVGRAIVSDAAMVTGAAAALAAEPLSAAVLVALFDVMRLPPSGYSHQYESIVLRQDHQTLHPDTYRRRRLAMVAFSRFYAYLLTKLEAVYAVSQDTVKRVLHDVELLFFYTVCYGHLPPDAAPQVLAQPHFAYAHTYEILPEHKGDQSETLASALAAIMREWHAVWMPHVEMRDQIDYTKRIEPLKTSIENVLLSMCVEQALPAVLIGLAPLAAAPVPPPAQGPAQSPQPPAQAAASEGEQEVAEPTDAEASAEPAAATATGAAAEPLVEPVEKKLAALIGAAADACPRHSGRWLSAACPAACIAKRLGAPHQRTNATTLTTLQSSRLAMAQAGRERGVAAMIGTQMLGANRQYLAPLVVGGSVTHARPASAAEWGAVIRGAFDGANPPRPSDLVGLDQLAHAGGWATASAADKAKRYVAAYCGERLDQVTREAGLSPLTTDQAAAVAAYRRSNPAPAMRTVQTLVHLAGRD